MEPERWSHVNELVGRALEHPPEERSAFLAACEDSDVRREAASLLAQETGALSSLERPPLPLVEAVPEIAPGQRIGAYRVVSELGRGGMGVVYLAERADQEFERRVAVKVLKRGLDTAEIVRRFRTERQILANLEHPGIAGLYEGGTTEDGRPYFVLEHVEGEPLLAYCDGRGLGVRARLELFRRVAEAVQVAHQNLVVHRDLKPANILVTPAGQPKLLDFGIAKLLDPETEEGLPQTAFGIRPMTPAYASPEQVKGEPVTTATDVYALGLLLYELLTGRHPYRIERSERTERPGASKEPSPGPTAAELTRAVCEAEPVKPSVAVVRPQGLPSGWTSAGRRSAGELSRARGEAPGRLARLLAGDLDNIVLKAMEKDPRRRYASVEQLSEDVGRHLAGLPVRARKPTLGYRLRKLVRRRGRELAAATVAVAALAGFLVDRELQQRQTARALTRAERVTELLVELFEVSDPGEARGETITAREVLDRGAERIHTELDEEPAVRAALMHTIGTVYHGLGLYGASESMLREALALRRRLPATTPRELRESLYEIAYLLYDRGDLQASEELYREALEVGGDAVDERDPATPKILNNLGLILHSRGDYEGAEALYRQALAINRTLYGDLHPDVPVGLANLGAVLRWRGDDEGAEAMFRESLGLARKLFGEQHPKVAMDLNSLSMLEASRGNLEEGERHLREALEINRRIYGEEHPSIALVLGNLCGVLHARGRLGEAEIACTRALEMSRRLIGEHPRVAAKMVTLASVMIDQGRAVDAEPLLRRALAMYQGTLPSGHWRIADAESVLGACLTHLGRYPEAERLLVESYPTLRSDTPPGSRQSREARARLRALYLAWGKPAEAAGYEDPAGRPGPV